MRKNLAATLELARANGVPVLLAGMRVPPNYGKKYEADFARAFVEQRRHRVALRSGCLRLGLRRCKAHGCEGLRGNGYGCSDHVARRIEERRDGLASARGGLADPLAEAAKHLVADDLGDGTDGEARDRSAAKHAGSGACRHAERRALHFVGDRAHHARARCWRGCDERLDALLDGAVLLEDLRSCFEGGESLATEAVSHVRGLQVVRVSDQIDER